MLFNLHRSQLSMELFPLPLINDKMSPEIANQYQNAPFGYQFFILGSAIARAKDLSPGSNADNLDNLDNLAMQLYYPIEGIKEAGLNTTLKSIICIRIS